MKAEARNTAELCGPPGIEERVLSDVPRSGNIYLPLLSLSNGQHMVIFSIIKVGVRSMGAVCTIAHVPCRAKGTSVVVSDKSLVPLLFTFVSLHLTLHVFLLRALCYMCFSLSITYMFPFSISLSFSLSLSRSLSLSLGHPSSKTAEMKKNGIYMPVPKRTWEEEQIDLIRAERRYWESLNESQIKSLEYWSYRRELVDSLRYNEKEEGRRNEQDDQGRRSASTMFENSFSVLGAKLWNTLPKCVKDAGNIDELKVVLGEYLRGIADRPPTRGYSRFGRDMDAQKSNLSKKSQLRGTEKYDKVYISPDRTQEERSVRKQLVDRLINRKRLKSGCLSLLTIRSFGARNGLGLSVRVWLGFGFGLGTLLVARTCKVAARHPDYNRALINLGMHFKRLDLRSLLVNITCNTPISRNLRSSRLKRTSIVHWVIAPSICGIAVWPARD
eukprot:sb/3464723/